MLKMAYNTLPKEEIEEIREELKNTDKPLIFYHGDPDGLASFLLLYRYMGKECKGVAVKGQSVLDESFFKKVEEYGPDKVIVVDIPIIDETFHEKIIKSGVKTVWIDHHDPKKLRGIKYFNPRMHDKKAYIPASYVCFDVVQQDLWIASVGVSGDGLFPPFSDEIRKKYPDLLPENVKTADDILLDSKLGELINIFSFILNGKTKEANKCVNVLTRINDPYEILEQKTARGKFVFQRYMKFKKKFDLLLKKAEGLDNEDFVVFIYSADMSFTKDLANKLSYKFPDKIVIVGRDKDGEVKLSIRAKKMIIPPVLKESFNCVDGSGGGHEHACGANIKSKEFEHWLNKFKSLSKGKND